MRGRGCKHGERERVEAREARTHFINTKSKSNKKQNYKNVGFFLVGYLTRSIIKIKYMNQFHVLFPKLD